MIFTFQEVGDVPRLTKRRPSQSKYKTLIDETEKRIERTPRHKWLVIARVEPMTKREARNIATAIYSHFRRHHGGEGALERRVRPNGCPDCYDIYVRRGKNYSK
jgi:hypothetical protein